MLKVLRAPYCVHHTDYEYSVQSIAQSLSKPLASGKAQHHDSRLRQAPPFNNGPDSSR